MNRDALDPPGRWAAPPKETRPEPGKGDADPEPELPAPRRVVDEPVAVPPGPLPPLGDVPLPPIRDEP